MCDNARFPFVQSQCFPLFDLASDWLVGHCGYVSWHIEINDALAQAWTIAHRMHVPFASAIMCATVLIDCSERPVSRSAASRV
jgi:hypothetical protein